MVFRICFVNSGKQIAINKAVHQFVQPKRSIQTTAIQSGLLRRYFRSILSYPRERRMSPPWKHCTQIGDPVLRQVATEVPIDYVRENNTELKFLLKQMEQVLHDYKLVGIAAPQIGVSLRVFLMEFTQKHRDNFTKDEYTARDMAVMPLTAVINPVIKVTNYEQKVFSEGCASICGYTADVPRYYELVLSGFDENGEPFEKPMKGWNARIVQHELDHLNGQLYVDIMKKKSFTCGIWQDVNKHEGQLFIPFYPKDNIL